MEAFPVIHTNFWDAVIAVPIVVIILIIIKLSFRTSNFFIPTIANVLGFIVSIFFAHKRDLSAGIFIGFFYGNTAVGVYYSMTLTLQSYIKQKQKQKYISRKGRNILNLIQKIINSNTPNNL